MVGDELGVATDTVDEVGVAVVLEALAEDVVAGDGRDAATLLDLTRVVKDREIEPLVSAGVAVAHTTLLIASIEMDGVGRVPA